MFHPFFSFHLKEWKIECLLPGEVCPACTSCLLFCVKLCFVLQDNFSLFRFLKMNGENKEKRESEKTGEKEKQTIEALVSSRLNVGNTELQSKQRQSFFLLLDKP